MKKIFTLFAVAVLAFAAQANELTVCDGTTEGTGAPFWGLYYDTPNTTCQFIYPADKLTVMNGGQITEIKFYPKNAFTGLGVGNLQLAFKIVDQLGFAEAVLVTGTEVVANGAPVDGATELVFTLNEPYQYNGGNLLMETVVTQAGSFKSTYFLGMDPGYTSNLVQYSYAWSTSAYYDTDDFLPKATFTYQGGGEEPTEQCLAPNSGYEITGVEEATVTITNREEGATVVYEVYCDGELIDSGSFTGDEYSFSVTGAGSYVIHAIATMQGMLDSPDGGVFFTIMENEGPTGVNELVNGKNVASVRYFNVAGQEMQEANGMTIVVTTYTDGTTSTAKVVK